MHPAKLRPIWNNSVKTGIFGLSWLLAATGFCLDARPESRPAFQEIQGAIQDHLQACLNATVLVGEGGSGVIVSPEGLVLTAAHVSGAPGRLIECRLRDGRRVRARTLGRFELADAGMARIEDDGPFDHVELAEAGGAEIGDWCFALGHPGGWEEARGAVLRIVKVISARGGLMRTGCKLLRGDSGGPLFDLQGRLIGIHSRIGDPLDDNYHAPAKAFRRMWEPLIAGESMPGFRRGDAGYLGVGTRSHALGRVITEILPESPAETAGLKEGDIILTVDEVVVDEGIYLDWAIGRRRSGEEVNVMVRRDGNDRGFKVELADRPERGRRRGRS